MGRPLGCYKTVEQYCVMLRPGICDPVMFFRS